MDDATAQLYQSWETRIDIQKLGETTMSKTIKKRTLSDITSSSNDSEFLYNV